MLDEINKIPQNSIEKCAFSVIVPVLNEAERINGCIAHIHSRAARQTYEIIVADGDEKSSTIKAIENNSVKTICSRKGRGTQMNAAAAIAEGRILVFLHADTELPPNALEKIDRVMENENYVAGAFDLSIVSNKLLLKWIAINANIRSRFTRIPYGDQAIFIRKKYFDKIGGFSNIPLMEDVDLMRRIKKDRKKIYILPDKVITSSRKWEHYGLFYTTFQNQVFLALFYLGVNPEKLTKYYWRNSNEKQKC